MKKGLYTNDLIYEVEGEISKFWFHNEEQAFHFYLDQASYGDCNAIFLTAYLYHHGRGVKQNLQQAIHFYTLGCRVKDPRALFSMGIIHYHGLGIKQDKAEAFRYFTLATQTYHHYQILPTALYNLGWMFMLGEGV